MDKGDTILVYKILHGVLVALVAYTSERLSVQLTLNIIVLRLSRMQPKNDTFIVLKLMRAPWDKLDRQSTSFCRV